MRLCKKIFRIALLTFIILMLMSETVLAAYSYYATVQVQETGGNSYDYLPVIADIDNNYLSANGYISPTGLDTRILSGSTELEHLVVDDQVLFIIPSVAANSTGNYRYTLGNDPLDDFPIITGKDGYITISDDTDLELGNNFVIELRGYINTASGEDKNILYKRNGIAIYISDSENITAAFITDTTGIEYLLPMGTGTYSEIGGVNDWQSVDDPVGAPDDGGSKIQTDGDYVLDTFLTSDSLLASDTIINNVRVYVRIGSDGGTNRAYAQPVILLDGSQSAGSITPATNGWTTYSSQISKPGGGVWTVANLNDMEIGLRLREQGGAADAMCTQVYGAVEYVTGFSNDVDVTAINVSSGVHTIKVTADGTNLEISIDSAVAGDGYDTTVLGVETVPNNGYEWVLDQNNVMPYMEYYKHTVSGTLIAWYQPISMIIGTTLDDREGTDAGETGAAEEDAAITWGSNPANLSATIGSLISSSQPGIVSAGEDGAIDVVPEGEVPTAGGVVNVGKLDNNPLYFAVEIISEYTGYTEEQIWFIGATIIILIGMGISAVKVPNHLLLAGTVGLVLGGFFMAMEIYQWWMMLIFGFMFVMTILMERKPTL